MGLKALGNYLDQFWSHTILVLLCEGPEPPNSMISVFWSPGDSVFMDSNIPNYFNNYKENMDTFQN